MSNNSYIINTGRTIRWVGDINQQITDEINCLIKKSQLFKSYVCDWQESVKEVISTLPGSPSVGNRYLFTGSGNYENCIIEWSGSEWYTTSPDEGMVTYVESEDILYFYTNNSWSTQPVLPHTHIENDITNLDKYSQEYLDDHKPERITPTGSYTEINYWIDDTSGSDENPGTETEPFKTIQHALSILPRIADSWVSVYIYCKPGTYTLTNTIRLSGFSNVDINISSSTYDQDDVVIVGVEEYEIFNLTLNSGTIWITDVTLQSKGDWSMCVTAFGCSQVVLQSIKFEDNGSYSSFGVVGAGSRIKINSCTDGVNKVDFGIVNLGDAIIMVDDSSSFGNTFKYPGTIIMKEGVSGTFTTNDGKTVTVIDGRITSIV